MDNLLTVVRVQLDLWLPSSRYYRSHRCWVQLEQLMLLQDVHPEAQDVVAAWVCQPLLDFLGTHKGGFAIPQCTATPHGSHTELDGNVDAVPKKMGVRCVAHAQASVLNWMQVNSEIM